MSFFGYDFYDDGSSLDNGLPTDVHFEKAVIKNCVADTLFINNGAELIEDYESAAWTNDTILNATFDGNLLGGDISYTIDKLTSMRVKKREVGSTSWITLYEKELNTAEDLSFTFIDKYADGRTEYEYAIVPLVGNIEQTISAVKCYSEFDGAVITDGIVSYHVLLEPMVSSVDRVKNSSVVTTIGSKYPYVFFGGEANYDSGSFSGVAIEFIYDNCAFDIENGTKYRKNFVEWLTNGRSKILKMHDGRTWMMSIYDNVNLGYSDHYEKMIISFPFVEIGSMKSSNDLYNNGFINCNVEGN